METLSFDPLIYLMREKRESCNRLFSTYSVKYPMLEPDHVKQAMVTILQPVMRELHTADPVVFESVFDRVFEALLDLEGSGRLQASGEQFRSVLMLIPGVRHEALIYPATIVRSFVNATKTFISWHPDGIDPWIRMMKKVVPACNNSDQVLDTGRLCAWRSGLAHLRERALYAMDRLPRDVVASVFNSSPETLSTESIRNNPWFRPGNTESDTTHEGLMLKYRTGGFRGLRGPFLKPPVVAALEGHIVATDGESSCLVFADTYGVSIVNDIPVPPVEVKGEAEKIRKQSPVVSLTGDPFSKSDIRSQAMVGNTLVLSRHSSHYLYVYGQ